MGKIIVPIPKSVVESIDEKKGDLSREAFLETCITHTLGLKDTLGTKELKELPWKESFDRAWLTAFLFYGIVESVTAYISLNRAGRFGDPVLQFLFKNNFYAVVPFKIAILLSCLLVSYSLIDNKRNSLLVPTVLTVVGMLFILIDIIYII